MHLDDHNIWSDDGYLQYGESSIFSIKVEMPKSIDIDKYHMTSSGIDLRRWIFYHSSSICSSLGINNCSVCDEKCLLYNDLVDSLSHYTIFIIRSSQDDILYRSNVYIDELLINLSDKYGYKFSLSYTEKLRKLVNDALVKLIKSIQQYE